MAGTNQWCDPLLITDAFLQNDETLINQNRDLDLSWCGDVMEDEIEFMKEDVYQRNKVYKPATEGCVEIMKADDGCNGYIASADTNGIISEGSPEIVKRARFEEIEPRMYISFEKDIYDCKVISASPDLIMCETSPNIPQNCNGRSPDFLNRNYEEYIGENVDISFDKCFDNECKSPEVKDEQVWPASSKKDSFELRPQSQNHDNMPHNHVSILHLNSGLTVGDMISFSGVYYVNDDLFEGGDTMKTDVVFGDGECWSLYQTARYGNFSYKFQFMEPGTYVVDLHFAEVEYNLPGMRVFNILIQDKMVVSGLDIYDRVGSNTPLVLSGLKAHLDAEGEVTVRFEGVVGSPMLCGISLWKVSCQSASVSDLSKSSLREICGNLNENGNIQQLCKDCEDKRNELHEKKRLIEELKRQNQLISRERQEACNSLHELQNELMRKSMHVGSLAFAVEGQVKEKSKWFSSLRDLTRKLKIMKMEQIELSKLAAAEYKNCLSEFTDMSSIMMSTINREANLHRELRVKFVEGSKERKELYNKVLELKGNIRVFCRSRPLNAEEISTGASMVIDFESAKNGEISVKSGGIPKKIFKFDAVFCPQADQADVFQDTAPLIRSVLDGYNVCIFAYGQTGTGKTFTMEGTHEARGVNYRTLDELFHLINRRENQYKYEVSVSALEVYNEQIRDLLVSGTRPGTSTKRLEIRQIGDGVHVPGLVEAPVKNMSEVWEVLKVGSNARTVGSTNANEYSSRSHCIHCVMVKSENLLNGECTRSKLWLVDLAGSERIAKTEVQGERLKEAQNINRSLSALGDVISALASKSSHIPFRNSKLTHLLQDSLGGDSKTLMFVQVSPSEDDLSETLCSLNFASRVRGIELGPAKKQVDANEFLKYKLTVEKMKHELKSKDVQVKKMENAMQNLDTKEKEADMKNKLLLEKVKELEKQLILERKLALQNTESNQAGHQRQSQKQEQTVVAATRPPLASQPSELYKNTSELQGQALLCKEQSYVQCPLTQNDNFDLIEKENNPEMAEFNVLPPRTGRASSICTAARRVSILQNPSRRDSLIPLPRIPTSTPFSKPFFMNDQSNGGSQEGCFSKPILEESPKGLRGAGGKKMSNFLRRSIQKKGQINPGMPQQMRKGGVNVGDKIRLSIRGRMARRVLQGNSGRRQDINAQHKLIQEKEKGWNVGTGGRNLL